MEYSKLKNLWVERVCLKSTSMLQSLSVPKQQFLNITKWLQRLNAFFFTE